MTGEDAGGADDAVTWAKGQAMVEIIRADALYRQLANVVRDEIAHGKWAPGEFLPSEAVMSEVYKVSRPTVRQALIALRAEGLIGVRMGKGSYVRRSYNSAAATIDRSGTGPARLLKPTAEPNGYRQNADAPTAELLGISEDDPMFVLELPTIEDGTGRKVLTRRLLPVAITANTPLATDHFPERSALLTALTERHGKLSAIEYVRTRMPNPDETTALELSDITPLLETILVTSAKRGPVLAESERTSGEAVQLSYPVKQL
ncbi:GntR family transcriptional regulator [Catenulispora rubra]|uniref:GntR family transcriptional regulator n=1 Tax=Catenulispora rubra TaxID=280293 RepID=UPI00189212EA|nr:GntR family transcriptional regulator [Catenulispora rubra]